MIKISPSAIKTWRRCKRLYAFGYNEGLWPPSTPKQEFGTRVHEVLEKWLRLAIPPDPLTPEGSVALQGIRNGWLPVPAETLMVEHRFTLPLSDGLGLTGIIDCVEYHDNIHQNIPLVLDHKTTSDLRWAMAEQELASDPQALIYATWAMLQFNRPRAKCRWVYYAASNPAKGQRKPKGTKMVELVIDSQGPAYIAHMRQLLQDIEDMAQVRREKRPGLDFPAAPTACGQYGGCAHVDRCALSPDDMLTAAIDTLRQAKK